MAVKIIVDTIHIIGLLSDKRYLPLAKAIDEDKVNAKISVISITELFKILGKYNIERTKITLNYLKSSKIDIEPLEISIAEKAWDLKLKYDITTADALIGATGIKHGMDHILTTGDHFKPIRSHIEPIRINKLIEIIT